ncbi:hypothetical protein P8C59_008770 [Phyllachora maydis]|uniref:Uncharacterized protein n=1 Tax=Phyllachora maydis TaxID=1825666 RepID=A0AAD9IC52_9PEZI|nr:hypothetical protein P8C59_008770 [Phyllachora maydis]
MSAPNIWIRQYAAVALPPQRFLRFASLERLYRQTQPAFEHALLMCALETEAATHRILATFNARLARFQAQEHVVRKELLITAGVDRGRTGQPAIVLQHSAKLAELTELTGEIYRQTLQQRGAGLGLDEAGSSAMIRGDGPRAKASTLTSRASTILGTASPPVSSPPRSPKHRMGRHDNRRGGSSSNSIGNASGRRSISSIRGSLKSRASALAVLVAGANVDQNRDMMAALYMLTEKERAQMRLQRELVRLGRQRFVGVKQKLRDLKAFRERRLFALEWTRLSTPMESNAGVGFGRTSPLKNKTLPDGRIALEETMGEALVLRPVVFPARYSVARGKMEGE